MFLFNVYRSLVNLILDPLSPTHVCQTKAQSHNPSFLTVQPSTFSSQVEKVIWGMSACMLAHTQRNWDVEDSSRSSGPSALICWNPWKPWPGLSEGLNCASSYIHAAFSHPNISAIFKGPGKLYVFHLTSGIRVPMIVACLGFFFLPQRHKAGGICLCEMPNTLFVL